ncbi:hypothetical protein, partial [Variovorax boronicumulans]|uniref:hypothetical protein n=1 Tax=Variovorax boronicumulans TaxID=436515 RepID=UPI001C5630DA
NAAACIPLNTHSVHAVMRPSVLARKLDIEQAVALPARRARANEFIQQFLAQRFQVMAAEDACMNGL